MIWLEPDYFRYSSCGHVSKDESRDYYTLHIVFINLRVKCDFNMLCSYSITCISLRTNIMNTVIPLFVSLHSS